MKRLILSLALVLAALFVTTATADKPVNEEKGKRAAAQERRRGHQRDPAKMAARIMTEFDKDGDEKLDKTELAAWLKAMHERRGAKMRKGGKQRKGKAGPGGKRRRGDNDNATPGGERPNRPKSE